MSVCLSVWLSIVISNTALYCLSTTYHWAMDYQHTQCLNGFKMNLSECYTNWMQILAGIEKINWPCACLLSTATQTITGLYVSSLINAPAFRPSQLLLILYCLGERNLNTYIQIVKPDLSNEHHPFAQESEGEQSGNTTTRLLLIKILDSQHVSWQLRVRRTDEWVEYHNIFQRGYDDRGIFRKLCFSSCPRLPKTHVNFYYNSNVNRAIALTVTNGW